MNFKSEVVIVGSGIAGGILASSLAANGISILVLEKRTTYDDIVRGEWMAPWGVEEAIRLGLYPLYMALGGQHTTTNISFDEYYSHEFARTNASNLTDLIPDVKGPLNIPHAELCTILNHRARQAGATILHNVEDVNVEAGKNPQVSFTYESSHYTIKPRLVIGADGRNGIVRNQVGIKLNKAFLHHYYLGLQLGGVRDWPNHLQCTCAGSEVSVAINPLKDDRVRTWMCVSPERIKEYSGPSMVDRYLKSLDLDCIEGIESIISGKPIGPCRAFPNHATWTDSPVTEGVVLVGDAAGNEDPTSGQGLSIAHRDSRIIRDILLDNNDWTPEVFTDYVDERYERMRRLRFASDIIAKKDVEFSPKAKERRIKLNERMRIDPSLATPLTALLVGPEKVSAEAFSKHAWDQIFNLNTKKIYTP